MAVMPLCPIENACSKIHNSPSKPIAVSNLARNRESNGITTTGIARHSKIIGGASHHRSCCNHCIKSEALSTDLKSLSQEKVKKPSSRRYHGKKQALISPMINHRAAVLFMKFRYRVVLIAPVGTDAKGSRFVRLPIRVCLSSLASSLRQHPSVQEGSYAY